MKVFLPLLVALGVLGAAASARAASFTVTVGDNFYSPATLSIHAGDVVTWRYQGNSMHPTASTTGAWATFMLDSSTPSKTLTFNTVGNFPYYCTMHGSPTGGMSGSITVTAALATTAAAQPMADLTVYPNPAAQTVRLEFAPLPGPTPGVLELLDARGAVVRRQAVALATHELLLPVADLPAGLYWCRLLVGRQQLAARQVQIGLP